jgi:hypothetical protein
VFRRIKKRDVYTTKQVCFLGYALCIIGVCYSMNIKLSGNEKANKNK